MLTSVVTIMCLVLFMSVLIALILRFVQPQLIYGLRSHVTRVQVNKAFIDLASKREVASNLAVLLAKDYRYESRVTDSAHALARMTKIRELYRLLDLRNYNPDREERPNPNVCIIELADIVRNQAQGLVPGRRPKKKVVSASDLILFIANTARRHDGEEAIMGESQIESWLRESPLSIEQLNEILIACVFAMSFRLESQSGIDRAPNQERFLEYWSYLVRAEQALRQLIKDSLIKRYQSDEKRRERLLYMLGTESGSVIRRVEKEGVDISDNCLVLLRYCYFADLASCIFRDWEEFKVYFGDKGWLKRRMDVIVPIRNSMAHGRELQRKERALTVAYSEEIMERIARVPMFEGEELIQP